MANVNNYIAAGRSSVRKNLTARKALADNKPDYGALGQEAIKAERDKKIAVIQANAKVANSAQNAMTQVKGAEIEVDRDKSIANSKRSERKAGMLAAGAQALGVANYLNNKKDKPNEQLSLIQQQLTKFNQRAEDARNQANSIDGETYKAPDTPSSSYTPSTGTNDQGKPVSTKLSAQQSSNPKGVMSKAAIKDLAVSTGFSPEQAAVVVGIAGGESGYDPTNSTRRLKGGLYDTTGEDSVGLMQINWGYHKDNGWLQDLGINSREDLFDPAKNMKAAKYLYDGRGGFGDWTVYNEGLYRDKM
jgi:hypothetical protein